MFACLDAYAYPEGRQTQEKQVPEGSKEAKQMKLLKLWVYDRGQNPANPWRPKYLMYLRPNSILRAYTLPDAGFSILALEIGVGSWGLTQFVSRVEFERATGCDGNYPQPAYYPDGLPGLGESYTASALGSDEPQPCDDPF